MTALDDSAPWPTAEKYVTADALAKHLAVSAWRRAVRSGDLMAALVATEKTDPGGGEQDAAWVAYMTNADALTAEYAVVRLLAHLSAVASRPADALAVKIWRDWSDSGRIREALHEVLKDYGIDPDEIADAARQARDEAETAPKESTHA